MERKTVKSGIVGAGFAGGFHYNNLRRVYGVEVEFQGVFSIPEAQNKAFAERHGVRAFDSLDALLDVVDVVHICTPACTHEELAVTALRRGKHAIVEKPLTGFFGDGSEDFNGENYPKEKVLAAAMASVRRMIEAERAGTGRLLYAENWVYAPAIQKEREIIEKTDAQCLWIYGEQGHSGSHAETYGYWKYSGGGSLVGKGCHPLTAALYLKRKEGLARNGKPIRPATVTSRIHALTRTPAFRDEGHIRCSYFDIEDIAMVHILFDDGTIADIVASDIVLGGVHNWLQVCANNHRTMCHINPSNAMETYNPVESNFKDIYVVEKTGTKQGWSNPAPDEDMATGYPQEMEAFYRSVAYGEPVESDSELAADTISAIYSAYVSSERGGAEVVIERV